MPRPQSNNVILDFVIPDGATDQYISIPQAMSLLNRKSYRDGYMYSVDYMEFIGRAGDILTVGKIPEGYTTIRAWQMGFEAWKNQRHNAMEETPGMSPGKWADFKCKFDVSDNLANRLRPCGLTSGGGMSLLITTGSNWEASSLQVNDAGAATTSQVFVGMLGPVTASYGALCQTWGNTRAGTVAPQPLIPGLASDSWITKTGEESSEMAEDVLNVIEDDNDFPPYANEEDHTLTPIYVGGELTAPGGVMVDTTVLGTTGRPSSMNGGLIPLGQLKVYPSWVDESPGPSRILRIHCTRGTYHGLAAMKMGDFN